jgi:cell division protein FtsL
MGNGKNFIRTGLKGLKSFNLREQFSYNGLVSNLPMIFLLAFLGIIYIGNRHKATSNLMELNRIQKELKEAKWEFSSVKKELNNKSMPSEVARMVKPLGLEEMDKPPYKIYPDE